MTLKELKQHFHSKLGTIYPKKEIDSFYYILIEHYLVLKRIDIALNPKKSIIDSYLKKINAALLELSKEIPIQYIIGESEFYGLTLKVDKNVLIPRPETEELVTWIIETIKNDRFQQLPTNNRQPSDINILDIGTGSGCIPIALAKNIPFSKLFAIDISLDALKVAKFNAKLNAVEIDFTQQNILNTNSLQNIFANVDSYRDHRETKSANEKEYSSINTPNDELRFDIIVSNPPYVRALEKQEIKNNVLMNEPHLALFVENSNPLLFYNKISDLALEFLSPSGLLFFEINQYLGKETVDLLKQKGFSQIELRKDIFGNDRMIQAKINKI